ncbi:glutaredoxin 3 [Nitzschia inconspicua]|uniref:glutamate--tRNA ligase n=1 Tax=Nitzschia inconspicua TaxID=303405 RepID=A0A9K3KHF0_9STRA|nr:glutaredoxin-like protein [Nitzschia inconspicua]KAG7343657.1 glutaredoxin 3 [Nitzschia inconspicua]
MVDLDSLKAEIDSIGNQIKQAKSDKSDKSVIDPLVKQLLAKKQEYADNNNGVGVDGKPFGAVSSATSSKKKDPAKAQASQEVNPENAAKKAAKKAEKAAKKAAHKAGGSAPPPPAGDSSNKNLAGTSTDPVVAPAAAVPANPNTIKTNAAVVVPTNASAISNFKVAPLQIVINPNAPKQGVMDRPYMALAVAVLTNTDVDLQITLAPRAPQAMLGLENGTLVGDLAMARFLYRRSPAGPCNVLTCTIEQEALQTSWIDYASSMTQLGVDQRLKGLAMTLEHALQTRTYLVGYSLSMADLALFAVLGWPCALTQQTAILAQLQDYPCATRWVKMLASHPALQKATQLALGDAEEAIFNYDDVLEPMVSGMNVLEGAIPGQVVTRFPPEPSGYLHIGHSKAVLLNDYYARRYKGRLIVRFDDTNPTKEKQEYQQSIVEDLELLGVHPDVVTYTSDYFGAIQAKALQLIQEGKAYMDDTPQEQMKEERANRIESKYRNSQTPEQAQQLFLDMCEGKPDTETWCLRAKIDMKSDNGTLRDPVLYRQNLTPHHRTGITYKAYPTYDLACPIVDSLEGVTHALRTTEYNDRDEQYQWLLKALGLRRVRIHAFSRVNFQYTVLSKRKLTWFVDQKLVNGWDDARMPTVRGVVRRGVQVPALKAYIYSQGASRRVVNMVWNSFWAENKKILDASAKRYMAIDAANHIPLTVVNGPTEASNTFLTAAFHPKDASMGERAIRISKDVILESIDVEGIVEGESIVLMRWGVVKITKVEETDGKVMAITGEFIPNGDFKTCKRKLSWMAKVSSNATVVLTEFDNLVCKDKLEETDRFEDFVNENTLATTTAVGDAGLKTLQQHDIIQLERRGFYRVDRPYINDAKPIVLYMIPDGKTKSMSGMTGKLIHH